MRHCGRGQKFPPKTRLLLAVSKRKMDDQVAKVWTSIQNKASGSCQQTEARQVQEFLVGHVLLSEERAVLWRVRLTVSAAAYSKAGLGTLKLLGPSGARSVKCKGIAVEIKCWALTT